MANSLAMNTSNAVAGLGTFLYTFTAADATNSSYMTCNVQSTLQLNSALQIVIKHNSSTIITAGGAATDPTPTQLSIGAGTKFAFVAGDTVSVIFSSSATPDNNPNGVKSVVNLYSGQ